MIDDLLRGNSEISRLPEAARPNFRRNMLLHSFSVFSTWIYLLILAKT